jgi:amino acid adenylation domain-containing protein
MSRQQGVTLFMTVLAAFQILLSRYSSQEHFIVGAPFSGRKRKELENLVGYLVSPVLLRADLSGNPTFLQLLARVRETALGAYTHADIPFQELLREIATERDLSFPSMFQVMFNLRKEVMESVSVSNLTFTPIAVERGSAKFDLSLAFNETPEGLKGLLGYNVELFESATIRRLANNLITLIEEIDANPEEKIARLRMMAEEERQQLLVEWNDTKTTAMPIRGIHDLIEPWAEKTPEATAVLFDDERLSYRELNRKANQLAHYLLELGVGPEVLVGIYMERSLEMIVGILGILKAGGAYVPLDPNYPSERLAFMLDDSRASVLITQSKMLSTLPVATFQPVGIPTIENQKSKIQNPIVVCLDTEWENISKESEENPTADLNADDLAYVIYTSGSTGKPKGVEITHRALSNFVHHTIDKLALSSDDRVLQFASIGFDTAAEEIFPCLTRGATLVLRTECMIDSVSQFLEKCQEWGVTVLDLPTVYWQELTESLSSEQLTVPEQLRLVIIGGEKAIPERLVQWQKAAGDSVRLLNTYGPTEATVVATTWEATGSAQTAKSLYRVPIGRPISNVQTYILDRYLNPVPIGVRGELYIGGAGLARGYLNCPELTAEKFIPNPFSDTTGTRLYKTGDLARYLPNGNIEFLGRIDNQVKIRGFRIELGEIEAALRQHPAVRDVAVTAREEAAADQDVPENPKSKTCPESNRRIENQKSGDRRLVAYVVLNQVRTVTIAELRNYLKAKLPQYMVPSAFVLLDALPLTPNGKLDRKALPFPDASNTESDQNYVAPRTPDEEQIARIWTEVLGVNRVSIHDNFFDLGGHSLLATQLVSRVRKEFEIDLPLRSLFEAPTVAGMAAAVLQKRCESTKQQDLSELLSELESLASNEAQRLLPQEAAKIEA